MGIFPSLPFDKWVKIGIFVCCVWALPVQTFAQLGDLRHSRQPLPGISDIATIGLAVDIGQAQSIVRPATIIASLRPRLEMLGCHVVLAPQPLPEGLWVQVDCQALLKKIAPPSQRPSKRLQSKMNPPCHVAYRYQQKIVPWRNIDRIIYSESMTTMQTIAQMGGALKPEECVRQFFNLYDLPILMAAEWGHVDRLIQALKYPGVSVSRQQLILTLLGEIQASEGYPILVEKLQDASVAKEAAEALGFFGLRAQKDLISILQDRSNSTLQEAAAKGLGRIAAATGNSQQTPLYLKMVIDESLDIRVRTQLVWALGKSPDMRAYSTLLELEQDIWIDHSQDPLLQEFRRAVDWSTREVKQGGHGGDF